MKKFLITTAALVAAVAVWVGFILPPAPLTLAPVPDGTVPGVIHVHTSRSDGLGTPDDIAAAAARAGLAFVVFTDHGDGTRAPDPPTYRSGVLCLDGVEVSTVGGHYLTIGLPRTPYPLGGDARDVVEDVRRLGGIGIAAHPDSPKPDLAWRDWAAPVDGVELLNLDTSWRFLARGGWRSRLRLVEALATYPLRPAATIAGLIQPSTSLPAWAAAAERRRVLVAAGADAHARLAPPGAEPGESRFALPLPGYESAFRVMSLRVRPDRAFTGRASEDAPLLVHALREGHFYTALDAVASPPALEFTAANALGAAGPGDQLGLGGPVSLRIRSNAPPGYTTLVRDGLRVLSTTRDAQDLIVQAGDGPGVYWVEIVSPAPRSIVWVRSNPIYVRAPQVAERAPLPPPPVTSSPLFDADTDVTAGWHAEADAASTATLEQVPGHGGAMALRFALAGEPKANQFGSLAFDLAAGLDGYDRLSLTLKADGPMRLSVQLRTDDRRRWHRSIFVDDTERTRTIPLADFTPVSATDPAHPALDRVRALLLVVDILNTSPGAAGRVAVRRVAIER